MKYADFLAAKAQKNTGHGFEPTDIPAHLFDFQAELVEWAVRQGRAAIFADCGLGKTPMELAWAENVHRHTGRPVLLLTPLAVGFQIVREAEKFGHDAAMTRAGKPVAPITVTNYEQAGKVDPGDFGGVVCDESSAIKAFDGTTRAVVTELMREMPYRLLGTATAAPNDYLELGTSSEALGELGYTDMLGRFFVNDNRTVTSRSSFAAAGHSVGWRFKGHAEQPFWRWVSSWARAIRKPSDYGYSDDGFTLPELIENLHVVGSSIGREDTLFDVPAIGLAEERAELRRSLPDRCEKAAELATAHDISVIWCSLNDEGDLLERLIPRSIQIKGSDSADVKEKAAAWFKGELCICNDRDFSLVMTPIDLNAPGCTCGHIDGQRRLISKASIFGWGLNFQHCSHIVYFPTHSYESFYQAVRRCWRFGQKEPVTVDVVATPSIEGMLSNLQRKSEQADRMFDALLHHMTDALTVQRRNDHNKRMEIPTWVA